MTPTPEAIDHEPDRWLIVRSVLVLLCSAATAFAALVLCGIGGLFLVPLVLVAGVVHSFLRSPVAWLCYGFLIVGLSAGMAISDGKVGLLPESTPLWIGAGLAGFAMLCAGYARILLRGGVGRRAGEGKRDGEKYEPVESPKTD